eukprot:comp20225_c0_seq1/m.40078 comp20225_c0_seq1/g.40078  ORF comp20225_c0_seq1/g.40078 comp20225_c0_seq1/m.40078 type:complete len:355 (-) comp20225_c0_seq1:101-1165(-)
MVALLIVEEALECIHVYAVLDGLHDTLHDSDVIGQLAVLAHLCDSPAARQAVLDGAEAAGGEIGHIAPAVRVPLALDNAAVDVPPLGKAGVLLWGVVVELIHDEHAVFRCLEKVAGLIVALEDLDVEVDCVCGLPLDESVAGAWDVCEIDGGVDETIALVREGGHHICKDMLCVPSVVHLLEAEHKWIWVALHDFCVAVEVVLFGQQDFEDDLLEPADQILLAEVHVIACDQVVNVEGPHRGPVDGVGHKLAVEQGPRMGPSVARCWDSHVDLEHIFLAVVQKHLALFNKQQKSLAVGLFTHHIALARHVVEVRARDAHGLGAREGVAAPAAQGLCDAPHIVAMHRAVQLARCD